jgi:hypothetical protein
MEMKCRYCGSEDVVKAVKGIINTLRNNFTNAMNARKGL